MQLEENKLYTYVEVIEYLNANRKAEIRLYVNIPGRKNLRALMFDDGDRFYSVNITEDVYMFQNKPVTRCIFGNGGVSAGVVNEVEY